VTARDEEGPAVRARRQAPARARPRLVGELVVIAALLVVYDRVRSLAEVRSSVADSHGWAILHTESVLHLRIEDALNSWLTGQRVVRWLAVDYYQYVHVSVALTVLVICYVRCPAAYRPVRNALVLTNVVGLAVFVLYPTAPPRLLPGAGFVDSVADAGFGSSHGPIPADQYGALPSLHLAWATWVAVAGFTITRRRVPRVLFVAHPLLTAVVVVATGNHYVLDVATGVLLGIAAAWASGLLSRNVGLTMSFMPVQRLAAVAAPRPLPAPKPRSPRPPWPWEPDSPGHDPPGRRAGGPPAVAAATATAFAEIRVEGDAGIIES
jgi:membrane-associated phospholipid phosphatase